MTGPDLVAQLMRAQSEHYDRLLSDFVRQVEALDAPDAIARQMIERTRQLLAEDLERFAHELSAYAARGLRVDEPLH